MKNTLNRPLVNKWIDFVYKWFLIFLCSTQFAFGSSSEDDQELDIKSIQKAIDYLEDPQDIMRYFDCITTVDQVLPLSGLLCHHYAITKTLGFNSVPEVFRWKFGPEFLEKILDKYYVECNGGADSRCGDLVVYFDDDETVTHFGILRQEKMVESKWGKENTVFLHPILFVPSQYGTKVASYRAKNGVTAKALALLYEKMYSRTKKKVVKTSKRERETKSESVAQRLMRIMKPTPPHRRSKAFRPTASGPK